MFRNIWLHSEHQKFQKIIWRDDQSQPLGEFQLATVTYGTKAAPFLAMMILKRLAIDERSNYPSSIAPAVLESSFYMDDLLHGTHSAQTAIELKNDLIKLLKSGGFNLRKWRSNLPLLLEDMNDSEKEFDFKHQESTKTLGLRWNPNTDEFIFYPINYIPNITPTKRQLLSEISKIYDPLGWLVPVTTKLKILFQETWKSDLGWDQPIPHKLVLEWTKIKVDISYISQFKIPRWLQTQENDIVELHGFCDASTKAYACVVYCRIRRKDTTQYVTIVAATSKVVPIKKTLSIPRLELCGALLLAKLMKNIVESLSNFRVHVYGWVDSMAVLGWINGEPEKWKPFVANRVRMICEIIPKNMWRYINSSENPADCASRGSTALHLTSLSLWWHGPEWLSQCNLKEHSEKPTYTTDIDLKKKNLEISELSVAKVLNKKSQILNLNPVLDSTGLLRVGGRLKNSNIDPEMKYPIIIPSQSKKAITTKCTDESKMLRHRLKHKIEDDDDEE
ncbi:unnamed protein product [Pieris macdunnoughi]|uniref:Reverse transcriptase domain-containing protein n=1 Tax=Pieris macdunnoughi TaxID=345717 RepID=A0A821TWW2_9NEOP|nr:unnamed protein product [Pieris macdunnoughi]